MDKIKKDLFKMETSQKINKKKVRAARHENNQDAMKSQPSSMHDCLEKNVLCIAANSCWFSII